MNASQAASIVSVRNLKSFTLQILGLVKYCDAKAYLCSTPRTAYDHVMHRSYLYVKATRIAHSRSSGEMFGCVIVVTEALDRTLHRSSPFR